MSPWVIFIDNKKKKLKIAQNEFKNVININNRYKYLVKIASIYGVTGLYLNVNRYCFCIVIFTQIIVSITL